jgi:hypothetical protein
MLKLDEKSFNQKYCALILKGHFFEEGDYYVREKRRYFRTLQLLLASIGDRSDLSKLNVLEIGGGQMALLMHALFGSNAVVADVNDKYADYMRKQGPVYGLRLATR